MQLIATINVTSLQGAVTFSNIPTTYSHLALVFDAKTSGGGAGENFLVKPGAGTFNNPQGARVTQSGTSFNEDTSNAPMIHAGYFATDFSFGILHLPFYQASNVPHLAYGFQKKDLREHSWTWGSANVGAYNSLTIQPESDQIYPNSQFKLYGIGATY